jgi:hypothetical protein
MIYTQRFLERLRRSRGLDTQRALAEFAARHNVDLPPLLATRAEPREPEALGDAPQPELNGTINGYSHDAAKADAATVPALPPSPSSACVEEPAPPELDPQREEHKRSDEIVNILISPAGAIRSPGMQRMLERAPAAVVDFFDQPGRLPVQPPSEEEKFFAEDGSWA